LFLTGWLAWGMFFTFKSEANQTIYRQWLKRFQHFFLASLLITGGVQLSSLLRDWGIGSLIPELMQSLWGWTWLASLFLAVTAYWIQHKSKWVDAAWILIIMIIEGIAGHAITFSPAWLRSDV